MAALVLAYGRIEVEEFERRIYERAAFLGRYAHQSWSEVMAMSVVDAERLATAVARIVEQENEISSQVSGAV